MTDFPHNDPGWQEFADHAIKNLIPKVDDSAYCLSIVPKKPEDRTDIKFCLELGVMLMLDKPIVFIVAPGSKIPDKIVRVADEIIEGTLDDERFKTRLTEALDRLSKKYGDDG